MVNRKLSNRKSTYPLLPYSQLVFEMTRCLPRVYSFPSVMRWREGADQRDRIENALRTALTNHPVLASRVDWRGRQYMAESKDILHGQYYDLDLEVKGEDLHLKLSGSRILGDGKSGEILLDDIERAYKGLPLEQDDYWGYVAAYEHRKTQPHYNSSQAWLMNEFSDETVPVRPAIDRKCLWTLMPPKPGLYQADYADLHVQIQSLSETQHLSMDGFFSSVRLLPLRSITARTKPPLHGHTRDARHRRNNGLWEVYIGIYRLKLVESRKSKVKSRI